MPRATASASPATLDWDSNSPPPPSTSETNALSVKIEDEGASTVVKGERREKGNKRWASDEDWERHRPVIARLYMKENKKLWQLVEYMAQEHGFHATPKMYKTRFKRWGLWKNTKAADVAEVLRQTAGDIPEATTTATTTTTTTTTTVLTLTTTTTTASTAEVAAAEAAQTSPSPVQPASTASPVNTHAASASPTHVFLVNGKQVSANRINRYIRNRCRQHRLRPADLSASLLHHHATATNNALLSPSTPSVPNPNYVPTSILAPLPTRPTSSKNPPTAPSRPTLTPPSPLADGTLPTKPTATSPRPAAPAWPCPSPNSTSYSRWLHRCWPTRHGMDQKGSRWPGSASPSCRGYWGPSRTRWGRRIRIWWCWCWLC
ncbi:Clr5 domain-containing protein [Bombardia bombarda]|uniref:Clr5 domain-containing protein n=1 Tax=Bombardia bombarda TaxID=252184 RepID=A0AA39TG90_9PEZI|nr:Clr5 domain-containing protein [Bombardia bombarda]